MHARKGQPHQQDKTRQLQRKLYLAAKKSRDRRFHALYDRIYRFDILWRAWEEVRANRGSAGVDEMTIEAVQQRGAKDFVEELSRQLREGSYKPAAVKRVYIPKADGRLRPLGIPTLRDRVVQQACRIVIEPIFEANFQDCSYGFRPKRSARQAVEEVRKDLVRKWRVIDADIQGFFDTIDHELLMQLLKRRISDRRVLKLIWQWLKAGVLEEGHKTVAEQGTPQGGVISPLLANIYLHVLDMYWQREYLGLGKLVRYADDFVVLCRGREQTQRAMEAVQRIMKKIKLRLHPQKTRIVELPEEGFDFLGFHFHKKHSQRSGKLIPLMWPSAESMQAIREKIRERTGREMLHHSMEEIVGSLNSIIRGWGNYFRTGNATKKLQSLDRYASYRMKRLRRKKQGRRGKPNLLECQEWFPKIGLEHFYQPGACGQTL